jgi:hypothetical protein
MCAAILQARRSLGAARTQFHYRRRGHFAQPSRIPPEFRIGDCREALRDIDPGSVALILTDPPWGTASEPLYRWLAEFASQVLMPGGSLLCFTGITTWFRDATIFAAYLQPCPLLAVRHTAERPVLGASPSTGLYIEGRRGRRQPGRRQ